MSSGLLFVQELEENGGERNKGQEIPSTWIRKKGICRWPEILCFSITAGFEPMELLLVSLFLLVTVNF